MISENLLIQFRQKKLAGKDNSRNRFNKRSSCLNNSEREVKPS